MNKDRKCWKIGWKKISGLGYFKIIPTGGRWGDSGKSSDFWAQRKVQPDWALCVYQVLYSTWTAGHRDLKLPKLEKSILSENNACNL